MTSVTHAITPIHNTVTPIKKRIKPTDVFAMLVQHDHTTVTKGGRQHGSVSQITIDIRFRVHKHQFATVFAIHTYSTRTHCKSARSNS